jgi:competence protein ComEC
VERDLSGNPAALLKGILLGDRQAFPQDLLDDFTVTGLTHILAVSGFNVAMVGLVGFTLLRALSLPRGASSLLVMALLALYALVTGMSPSVLRATLMAWALISGGMIERDTDALNTLALSAAVILGIWPLSLFDPGFQLSFVATLSLILLTRPLMDLARSLPGNRWKTWLWYPAAASLAAQAGSLPVMVGHFHAVSLVSFLANLPAAPLVSAATVLGLLTAIAGPAVPILGTLINGANYVILKLLLASVHLFAKVPWASVTVGGIHPLGYGLYYLGVGLCLPDIRASRFGKPCLLLALLLANGLAWQGVNRPGPGLEVVFLDVGQGDSTCLRFPDGKTMLVDGGNRAERFDAGAQVVVPYLRAMGIRRLDAVVATHPHDDHIGGLVEVLRRIPVGRYLDAGGVPSTWASRRIGEILAERKIPRIPLSAGDSLSGLGGVGALVLGPFASPAPRDSSRNRSLDSNDGSVTLRIAHRDVVWLLPGDAERIAEARLLAWGKRLDCDILKAGHHGSSTSTGSRFLEAVSPSIVVVSVGERNRFGHPDPALMERLKAKGIRVCRTDREGAIWMRSDEGGLEVLRWMREKN